jgi:hypothetical protein
VALQSNVSPGNNAAQWVFGPGTKKSVTDDPAAVARANGDLAFLGDPQAGPVWTTQAVMNPIITFLEARLRS